MCRCSHCDHAANQNPGNDPRSGAADLPNSGFSFDYAFGTAETEKGSTPLPAALPLFVSGLGGLGLLGWRRKRSKRLPEQTNKAKTEKSRGLAMKLIVLAFALAFALLNSEPAKAVHYNVNLFGTPPHGVTSTPNTIDPLYLQLTTCDSLTCGPPVEVTPLFTFSRDGTVNFGTVTLAPYQIFDQYGDQPDLVLFGVESNSFDLAFSIDFLGSLDDREVKTLTYTVSAGEVIGFAWVQGSYDAPIGNGHDDAPLSAALPLFATGLGAMGLIGWRWKRKAQAGV
jgi:hypothetical protein